MVSNRKIFNAESAAEPAAWYMVTASVLYRDDPPNAPDLQKLLTEAAEQGYVSIPLDKLPKDFQGRVLAVLEHKHLELIQEQQAIIDHRKHPDGNKKDKEEDERAEWLKNMGEKYREAYAHLEATLDRADTTLNEVDLELAAIKRKVDRELARLEENAIHFAPPDGRMIFRKGRDGFVDQYGTALDGDDLRKAREAAKGKFVSSYPDYLYVLDMQERVNVEIGKAQDVRTDIGKSRTNLNNENKDHHRGAGDLQAEDERIAAEVAERRKNADEGEKRLQIYIRNHAQSTSIQTIDNSLHISKDSAANQAQGFSDILISDDLDKRKNDPSSIKADISAKNDFKAPALGQIAVNVTPPGTSVPEADKVKPTTNSKKYENDLPDINI